MLAVCCGCKMKTYAADGNYEIADAEFLDKTDSDTPAVFGTWIGAEDKTNYTVRLYKNNRNIYSRVVKGTTVDFSSAVILKTTGAGKYTFTVTTTKGQNRITSDEFEITSKMVKLIRDRITKERKAARAAAGGGWEKGPGDIWIYYDSNGDQVKGRWIDVSGYRYYLDSSGIMLTGWHYLGRHYYYLEPNGTAEHPLGSMWRGATTPDGHQVDSSGARIGDDATAPAVRETARNSISFFLKEEQKAGTYSKLVGITCGSGTISNITYSSDPATWTNNAVGTVIFDLKLNEGIKATVNPGLICSRATSVKIIKRTAPDQMQIELQYLPRYQLKAPDNFMINTDGRISWEKVNLAAGYKVAVTASELDKEGNVFSKTKTYTVNTPKFVLSEHGYYDDAEVETITVQAVGSNKKTTADTVAVRLPSLTELRAKRTVDGEFKRVGGALTYTDENGEYARGWKEIGGYWYFFRNTGQAAGPGWYQDKEQRWYYFDEYNRMVTGQIVENGKKYTLNDGSNKALPLGALIE